MKPSNVKNREGQHVRQSSSRDPSRPPIPIGVAIVGIAAAGIAVALSSGCNTTRGVGQDIEALGDGIADTAEDAKN